jgi:type I restriction enzyme S subunit
MLPEGWETQRADTLCSKITKGASPKWQGFDYCDAGVLFVTSENVREHGVDVSKPKFLPPGFSEKQRNSVLEAGDVLINIVGASIGRLARFPEGLRPANINQAVCLARPRSIEHGEFILQYLKSPRGQRELVFGQSESARPNLSLADIRGLTIPVPPPEELDVILTILRTWDQAIETVDKLIDNARARKKALMQQLLTGKRRLPGFEGAWDEVRLGQIADVLVSNVDKKSRPEEPSVRLCNYMDVYHRDEITSDQEFMRATASEAQISKFRLRVSDVLITKDSETPGDIAVPAYVAETSADILCGYHLAILRPNNPRLGRFVKLFLCLPHTQHYFASRANGATRFGLTIESIRNAPVLMPSAEEAQCIADILQTQERVVQKLVSQRRCIKQEKRALMQQLLTGKRRVKTEEAA